MKIVFVIGAGASTEVGLPGGNEFKDKISELLEMPPLIQNHHKKDSGLIFDAFHHYVGNTTAETDVWDRYKKACSQIRNGLPLAASIDALLGSMRDKKDVVLCGKLAIAKSILDAERQSRLHSSNDQNVDVERRVQETWFVKFFRLIANSRDIEEFKERIKSIVFIIFNYDRCLEHFLWHALQKYYGINDCDATELISCMNIYHPYGSVGSIHLKSKSRIGFGAQPSAEGVLKLAQEIKTFSESTNDGFSINDMANHIREVEKLIFLGFAFHESNMTMLNVEDYSAIKRMPACYATTYGISNSDIQVIKQQINEKRTYEIRTSNIKCCEFFDEFWKSLVF